MSINGVISDISSVGILITGNYYGGTGTSTGSGATVGSKLFSERPSGIVTSLAGVLMSVTATPVIPELGFLFLNGDLLIGSVYSSGSTIDPADKEWAKTGGSITVKPDVIAPTIDSTDVLLWSGFNEGSASTSVRVEHFKGYTGTGSTHYKELQQTPADPSKIVVWLNGRALFASNGGIGIVGKRVYLKGGSEGYTANDSILASADLQWTVMYFTDSVYASKWSFETVTLSDTTWGSGQTTATLAKAVENVNNTMLFCNGQRECPGQYGVSVTGNSLINNSLNSTISSTDELVLIY